MREASYFGAIQFPSIAFYQFIKGDQGERVFSMCWRQKADATGRLVSNCKQPNHEPLPYACRCIRRTGYRPSALAKEAPPKHRDTVRHDRCASPLGAQLSGLSRPCNLEPALAGRPAQDHAKFRVTARALGQGCHRAEQIRWPRRTMRPGIFGICFCRESRMRSRGKQVLDYV